LRTGDPFFNPAQAEPSGADICVCSFCLCFYFGGGRIMVPSPLIGRIRLDIREPETVSLRVFADTSSAALSDLDKA
jgi:hypothetical protein